MTTYTPLTPEYTIAAELVTYQDAVERVLAHWDRHNDGRDAYFARSAVAEALRKIAQYGWKWYRGTLLLTTTASYSTGTVEYTHSTRTLTLSDGTWPALAALGRVLIDDNVYSVESRTSDTAIVLRTDENPGANVDAGTSYTWFRDQYRLPPDVIELGEPKDNERATGGPDLVQFGLDRRLSASVVRTYEPETYPWAYAIERDRRAAGKSLVLVPPPKTARTYAMASRWLPRPLNVERYNTGTITVTSTGTTATGTGTSWSSKHVGCVLRISENSRLPTSQYGARSNDLSLDMEVNAPSVTRMVTAVGGATSLTLDAAPGVALTGKAYTLSDPIDIDWNVCGIYWDRMVEYLFARNQMGIAGETLSMYARQMNQAFLEAVDMDALTNPAPNGLPLHRGIYEGDFDFSSLEWL
jgi:hypothetical protein